MTRHWKLWGVFALVTAQLATAAGKQASGVQERATAPPTQEEGREKLEAARDRLKAKVEDAKGTSRDDRQAVREARRDLRLSRREFLADRVRSADLGLWLRRAANASGLVVSDMSSRGVITQTGLQEGDEIVSVNGKSVSSERELIDLLFAENLRDQRVEVVVNRKGQRQTIYVQPKLFVEEYQNSESDQLLEYGILVDDRSPDKVVVQAVVPRSPAYYAGMRSGDQIVGVRGQRIGALADLVRTLVANASAPASIEVNRGNAIRQLEIEMPEARDGESRTTLRPNLDVPDAVRERGANTKQTNGQPQRTQP